jgi:hypothetical protein
MAISTVDRQNHGLGPITLPSPCQERVGYFIQHWPACRSFHPCDDLHTGGAYFGIMRHDIEITRHDLVALVAGLRKAHPSRRFGIELSGAPRERAPKSSYPRRGWRFGHCFRVTQVLGK